MYSNNQIIKSSYHLFVSLFLIYLIFFIKNLSLTIKIIITFISLFHLYDTWWFLNNDGNAPI
jgi:hypothetical protein